MGQLRYGLENDDLDEEEKAWREKFIEDMKTANKHINWTILGIIFITEVFLYKTSVSAAYRREIYQKYQKEDKEYKGVHYYWEPGDPEKRRLGLVE